MKRTAIPMRSCWMRAASVCFALILSVETLAAQQSYSSPAPKDAISMALGGISTALPGAESSFFGNPAGFAAPKASLTLVSADAWAYIKPTSPNIAALADAARSSNPLSAAAGLMPGNGGIGGGASVGIGYAGKGLGLGIFATTDDFAAGSGIPGAVLDSVTEIDAVIGLGVPVKLFGSTLSIGGDIRPFYLVSGTEPYAVAVDSLSPGGAGSYQTGLPGNPSVIDAGFGLAMDLGASLQLGSLGIGISARDISPSFPIWTGTFQQFFGSLANGSPPNAINSSNTAVLKPDVSVGMSWKPRLVPGFIDPALYLELQDPVWVVQNWEGIGSALDLLHAGVELKLLNFITLRGGINRGWLSAGAGLRLLFVDVNAAVFTEELGALPGNNPRTGVALQAAIRF